MQPTKDPQTLNQLFHQCVTFNKPDLLNYKQAGQWRALSSSEVAMQVRHTTMALYALGVRPGDRVGLLAENSANWILADLGILNCGAVTVPIYATQAPQQVDYILQDADLRVLFISNQAQYDRLYEVLRQQNQLKTLISFEPIQSRSAVFLDDFLISGEQAYQREPARYRWLHTQPTPSSLASLVYTSGTTGNPKGVMLTHGNLTSNILINSEMAQQLDPEKVTLSFLPFSHIYERNMVYMYLHKRSSVYLATNVETVMQDIAEVRPHFMTCVPRLFEKIYARTLEKAEAGGPTKVKIAQWALTVANQWARAKAREGIVSPFLSAKHKLADKLVLSKWRAALGGRIHTMVSGGAPLSPDLAYTFSGASITIHQGYGLTESAPVVSCNTWQADRIGSVGKPCRGVTVRIAGDGEILVSGPNVMQGYYKLPEVTAETLTQDEFGAIWLHTGDIGYLDADGFLFITDRKKDFIKTSGGKYIAPQPIETNLSRSRYINQVVIIGDGRKFPAALIVPELEQLTRFANLAGIAYANKAELLKHPSVQWLYQQEIATHTNDLSKSEKIKAFALLPQELSLSNGELTPTLKVRRRVVMDNYKNLIDQLYAEAEKEYQQMRKAA